MQHSTNESFTAPPMFISHLKMQVFDTQQVVNIFLKYIIVGLGTNEDMLSFSK